MEVKLEIYQEEQYRRDQEREEISGDKDDRRQPNTYNNHTTSSPVADIENYWPSLYAAAANNAVAEFMKVIDQVSKETGLDQTHIFSHVGPSEDTLLHVAASNGNGEIVELIITKVPRLLRKKDFNGDTVWHIAAKTGKVIDQLVTLRKKIEFYINYTASNLESEDITLRDINEERNTALHEALINRHKSIADKLYEVDKTVSFYRNKENKTAMYLAAEAGYTDILTSMLEYATTKGSSVNGVLKGKSIVHAAIMGKHKDVLALILENYGSLNEKVDAEGMAPLIRLSKTKDVEGMNPLHWAASRGFLEGIQYLLLGKNFSMDRDKKGLTPIHWAAMEGHVDVVKELIRNNHDSKNLLSRDGRNILHVAAKSGRHNVVSYILKTQELGCLLNKKDEQKNTPLHLATIHWHPKVVSALTQDKRVNLSSINDEGMTALDAAVFNMKGISSFRQWLTWQVIKAAGTPRATSSKVFNAKRKASTSSKSSNTTNYKIMVKALLLVSIIIAMVSFEAGSTKLAGYNNSNTDLGITTMLRHIKNCLFVICNTVAMGTSIVVIVILIWAHFGVENRVFTALRVAKPLLGMSLTTATLALVAGVYIVGSKVYWLADVVLTIGIGFLFFFATLFSPVCLPLPSGYRILCYITYFPIRMMILYICDHLEE